jgi:hypothetical protein
MARRRLAKTDRLLAKPPVTVGIRDVVGAWIVCLLVAVAALVGSACAEPVRSGVAGALIGLDPAATVAVVKIDTATADHERRC